MKEKKRRVASQWVRAHVVKVVCSSLCAAMVAAPVGAAPVTRTAEYDNANQPVRIVDAMGQATLIQRDAISRPTALTYADGHVTTLQYDLANTSKGLLSRIVDRSGTTEYTHDMFGRVVVKRQRLASGLAQQLSTAYDPARGLRTGITYPDGSVLTLGYDATGRLVRLDWNGAPLVTGLTWNPMGQPTGWRWAFVANPAASAASRSYDTAARLRATEFSSYVYDAAGRISALTQQLYRPADSDPSHTTVAASQVVTMVGYDPVGRITSFSSPGNESGFSYDANGNRTASTRTVNGQTTQRTFAVQYESNRLTGFGQRTGATGTTVAFGYNANGDTTSDGLRSFAYDAEGRFSAVTTGATDVSPTTRYAHNALGQRVFKTEPLYPAAAQVSPSAGSGMLQSMSALVSRLWSPGSTGSDKLGFAYMYDEDGSLLSETGTGGAQSTGSVNYIYLPTANGPMPIAAIINGAKYAVHADHLNTARRLTNDRGQVVWQWAYSAFGDEQPTLAKKRFANLEATPNPGSMNIVSPDFNLRYMGMYADRESGLFYNYFRTYDPRTGRYTQADPAGMGGGWNRFNYVSGNPLGFIDPDGLQQTRAGRPLENQLLEGGGGGMGGPTVSGSSPFGSVGPRLSGGRINADGVGSPCRQIPWNYPPRTDGDRTT